VLAVVLLLHRGVEPTPAAVREMVAHLSPQVGCA
jgi:hypothetical protein